MSDSLRDLAFDICVREEIGEDGPRVVRRMVPAPPTGFKERTWDDMPRVCAALTAITGREVSSYWRVTSGAPASCLSCYVCRFTDGTIACHVHPYDEDCPAVRIIRQHLTDTHTRDTAQGA